MKMRQLRLDSQNGQLKLRKPSEDKLDTSHSSGNSAIDASKCYLMTLPPEIRLSIYRYLLISSEYTDIFKSKEYRLTCRPRWEHPLKMHAQILRTCRQINKEGTPILFSKNVFRRSYRRPSKFTGGGARVFLSDSETSPITQANLASISRMYLFRDYDKWFRDGKLEILDGFPGLNELKVHIDMNEYLDMSGKSLESLKYDTLKAIHCDRPDIPCLKMKIRLAFHGQDYEDWNKSYKRGKESFSYHLIKKTELETWMQRESLFPDRSLSWSFLTVRSEYCGPSCNITFAFDTCQEKSKYIKCEVYDDDKTSRGLLEVDSGENEISV